MLEKFNNPFDYVTRIAVNPINGHVYAACYKSIMKSTDQGSSWIKVLGIFNTSDTGEVYSSGFTDVVITPDSGRIYASFSGSITNSDIDGIWTSISGDSSTYTRIAGNGSPGGWKTWQNYGRIVMEIAPSNPDILYAIYYNNNKVNCSIPFTNKPEADFFKYTRSTNS